MAVLAVLARSPLSSTILPALGVSLSLARSWLEIEALWPLSQMNCERSRPVFTAGVSAVVKYYSKPAIPVAILGRSAKALVFCPSPRKLPIPMYEYR